IVGEALRLGFLTSPQPGRIELHPLLRAFLDSRNHDTTANVAVAERLARYLSQREAWDEAFLLLERFFSKTLYEELLEGALPELLREARFPTLTLWLKLGRSRKVDIALVDFAEAEVAFRQGSWRKAEHFANRAAQRLPRSHPLTSRAYYTAGSSAHMEYRNADALALFNNARETAVDPEGMRDAIWGQIMSSVDLDRPEVPDLLQELHSKDDGSALSHLRTISAEVMVGIRSGKMERLLERVDSTQHLIERVQDPLAVSSFQISHAYLLAVASRYDEALAISVHAEAYAKAERLLFARPHATRMKSLANWGLRRFSTAARLVDSLERESRRASAPFLQLEAQLLRGRLLLAQQLFDRASAVLSQQPSLFPFEGERAEYLALLAVSEACAGRSSTALRLADEAEATGQTIEALVLVPACRAIVSTIAGAAYAPQLTMFAFRRALNLTNLDSFVVAYRACPALIAHLASDDDVRPLLEDLLNRARDTKLARSHSLTADPARPALLSPRER